MEREGLNRILHITTFNPVNHVLFKTIDNNFGQISFTHLLQDSVIFVHNYRDIKTFDSNTGEVNNLIIGTHPEDIVCMFHTIIHILSNGDHNLIEENEEKSLYTKGLVIAADKRGIICL